MKTAAAYLGIRAKLRHTLPSDVLTEAESIALDLVADDRRIDSNRDKYLRDLRIRFSEDADMQLLMSHLILGRFESAQSMVLKFIEDEASDVIEGLSEEERAEINRPIDPRSYEWKERGL